MTDDNGHVYIIKAEGTNYFKVGRTTNIEQRLEALRTGCPFDIVPVGFYRVDRATELELFLHYQLKKYRIRLEWFELPASVLEIVQSNLSKVCLPCECSDYCKGEETDLNQEFKKLFEFRVPPASPQNKEEPEEKREIDRTELWGLALSKPSEELGKVQKVPQLNLPAINEDKKTRGYFSSMESNQ